MKATTIFTRFGILGFVLMLLKVLADEAIWANGSDKTLTTAEMADTLFSAWSLPLMLLGILLALAMVGAAYLVRDERIENLTRFELGGEEE